MKLLPILLFALVMQCGAQTSFKQLNELCRERGHVWQFESKSYAADNVLRDNANYSALYNGVVWTLYKCKRCGVSKTEQTHTDSTVIWRKQPDITDSTSGLPDVEPASEPHSPATAFIEPGVVCLSPNGIYRHGEHSWISIATVEGTIMQVCTNCLQWRRKQ